MEKTSVHSSVSFQNNVPTWDFAETTAYPLTLKMGKQDITVYAFMTPYTPDELKAILKSAVSGFKREKRDVEIVREDKEIYKPLCTNHFVKLGNATGTPEDHVAWLNKYPERKSEVVEHSFGGLRIGSDPANEIEAVGAFDVSIEPAEFVETSQDIYDPDTDRVYKIEMLHTYAHPTESQYREYRSSRRNRFIRKSNLWSVTEQHSVLERLYDTVIESVSSAAVNGVACTRDAKSKWVAGIPLWHKLWVVDQIFGDVLEKND